MPAKSKITAPVTATLSLENRKLYDECFAMTTVKRVRDYRDVLSNGKTVGELIHNLGLTQETVKIHQAWKKLSSVCLSTIQEEEVDRKEYMLNGIKPGDFAIDHIRSKYIRSQELIAKRKQAKKIKDDAATAAASVSPTTAAVTPSFDELEVICEPVCTA